MLFTSTITISIYGPWGHRSAWLNPCVSQWSPISRSSSGLKRSSMRATFSRKAMAFHHQDSLLLVTIILKLSEAFSPHHASPSSNSRSHRVRLSAHGISNQWELRWAQNPSRCITSTQATSAKEKTRLSIALSNSIWSHVTKVHQEDSLWTEICSFLQGIIQQWKILAAKTWDSRVTCSTSTRRGPTAPLGMDFQTGWKALTTARSNSSKGSTSIGTFRISLHTRCRSKHLAWRIFQVCSHLIATKRRISSVILMIQLAKIRHRSRCPNRPVPR